MSLTLVLLLSGALVILLISINVIQQKKQKIERAKRQEMAKYRAIIEDTEQVLSMASALPFSPVLLRVLNQRILDCLISSSALEPRNRELMKRRDATQLQVENLAGQANKKPGPFVVPTDERKVIEIVKALKRIKTLVKTEHGKGKMSPSEFVEENKLIDQWQLKIGTTITFERAKAAFQLGQVGSAKQLLGKLMSMLKKNPAGNDPFYANMLERAIGMLEEIDEQQKSNLHEVRDEQEEKDDIDELFQPKKKW